VIDERRIPTRSPEWREIYARIQVALEVSSRLNALPFGDLQGRSVLLAELFGRPIPESAIVHPPFHSDYGLDTELGQQVFVGHGCSFLDVGGISIGDRSMISPRVTLVTEGHPVDAAERYDAITLASIVIEERVWIGAAATVLPGVRIGHDSVVGAGAVIAKDVPPLTVVTGSGQVVRKPLPRPSGA
jgi:acetyltransferase-like isoleucine patch superfamily enzyme